MIKDYQILKETITGSIKNSGLDVGAAYFIMKDVFSELEKIYFAQINKELLEDKKLNTENMEEK